MQDWRDILRRAKDAEGGGVAVMFACALPLLLVIVAGTIDFCRAMTDRQRLQEAVDSAALAAGRELGLSDARRENVQAAVEAMVARMMSANTNVASAPRVTTEISSDPLEVRVAARQASEPAFGGTFGFSPGEIEAVALARIVGRPNICLLGLNPSAAGTISLEKDARVTAQGCAVFSNSVSPQSIMSRSSSALTANLICAAGGSDGGKGAFLPDPLNDCPTFEDPLASRPEPASTPCGGTELVVAAMSGTTTRRTTSVKTSGSTGTVIKSAQTLSPGTFCGGLEITDGAAVTLEPGIYVIDGGALRVDDGARLIGTNVGFFFKGDRAKLRFERLSTIDLTAPRDGVMAGLLFFGSRSQPKNVRHEILSDDARNLLGTLYFPTGELSVDATSPIADKSAYTAIVARKVSLYGGPHLVLNSGFDKSEVPVPEGIRGAAQPVSLVK